MKRWLPAVLAAVIFFTGLNIIVKQGTASAAELVLRSRFITRFASSGAERRHNIALACRSLDAQRIKSGEEASFNEITGERTAERGYRTAKVIENGVYVAGIGGGVCQVSTTLYNALLLADIEITEVHKHTIRSSYIEPSFDAMVDYGYSDLKFRNGTGSDIVIRAAARGDDLVVEIHGVRMNCTIARRSEIDHIIEPEPIKVVADVAGDYQDKVIYQGEKYLIRKPAKGCYSKGYLIRTENGISVTTLIRTDYYSAVQGVEVEGTLKPE